MNRACVKSWQSKYTRTLKNTKLNINQLLSRCGQVLSITMNYQRKTKFVIKKLTLSTGIILDGPCSIEECL